MTLSADDPVGGVRWSSVRRWGSAPHEPAITNAAVCDSAPSWLPAMPLYVLPQRLNDLCLVPLTRACLRLKPLDHIVIDLQRDLTRHWPIEDAAARSRPVADLRNVVSIDPFFRECGQDVQVGFLIRGERSRTSLPHRPSAHVSSPCGRC